MKKKIENKVKKKAPLQIKSKINAKKPIKKEVKEEYDPMRASGNTAGGTDPTDGVISVRDLSNEWTTQNTLGDPFDTYSNNILNNNQVESIMSTDNFQSFQQI